MKKLHHVYYACSICALAQSVSAFCSTSRTSKSCTATKLGMQRRDLIAIITYTAAAPAQALDMDSFVNSQLEKDTIECNPKIDPKCAPKLTADEALCKYGVSGSDARLAACKRVRDVGGLLPTSKPGERNTAGWVNNPIPL